MPATTTSKALEPHTPLDPLELLAELDRAQPGVWDFAAPAFLTARALLEEVRLPNHERDPWRRRALLAVWQRCEPAAQRLVTRGIGRALARARSSGSRTARVRLERFAGLLIAYQAPPMLFCAEA